MSTLLIVNACLVLPVIHCCMHAAAVVQALLHAYKISDDAGFIICRSKRKEEQEEAGEALKANTHCKHALQATTALLKHSELPRIADQHSNRDPGMNGHTVNGSDVHQI